MKLVIENLQESIIIFDKKSLLDVNKKFIKQFGVMISKHYDHESSLRKPSVEILRDGFFSSKFKKIR